MTMGAWASAIITLLRIVGALLDYAKKRQYIKEGEDAIIARHTSDVLEKTETARRVREHLRDASDDDVGRLLEQDFRDAEGSGQLVLNLPTDTAKQKR